jgi:adenylylsulfate kinase
VTLVVWVDRIEKSTFQDTNRMFVPPQQYDLRVTRDGSAEYWAEQIAERVRPIFDPKRPTALFVGRYLPFHDGNKMLITEGLRRVGQVCVAVRDTSGTDTENPFPFEYVPTRIAHALREFEGRFLVLPIPNVTHVFYGRDVGYTVERIEMETTVEAISATDVRARMSPQTK